MSATASGLDSPYLVSTNICPWDPQCWNAAPNRFLAKPLSLTRLDALRQWHSSGLYNACFLMHFCSDTPSVYSPSVVLPVVLLLNSGNSSNSHDNNNNNDNSSSSNSNDDDDDDDDVRISISIVTNSPPACTVVHLKPSQYHRPRLLATDVSCQLESSLVLHSGPHISLLA
ncbi:hypothetical protein E4U14_008327 [Claviceps sp. LM454 group G7]|nr:hypothetical protein E4U14_008327 [Claviceps sp. LM454 group G7]